MLLQQIVATLDEELNRLSQLRKIVSGLAGSSVALLAGPALPPAHEVLDDGGIDAPAAPAEMPVQRVPARERRTRTVRSKTQPEPRALTAAIPAAPVVVTAKALAERNATARVRAEKHEQPAPAPGTLGSMIRALRLEANS